MKEKSITHIFKGTLACLVSWCRALTTFASYHQAERDVQHQQCGVHHNTTQEKSPNLLRVSPTI